MPDRPRSDDGPRADRGARGSRTAVICLAGKPPRRGTIVAELLDRLAAGGFPVTLELPARAGGLRTDHWPPDAVIVHRGLSRAALGDLAAAERGGRTVCNSALASLRVLDRPRLMRRLESRGVPVPPFAEVACWAAVRAAAEARAVVVKATDGAIGRGSRVLFGGASSLPLAPPFPGPYLVEERIPHDGLDRKLYVAGAACFGLLKPWPRTDGAAVAFVSSEALRSLALAVGPAVGLEIYGADVVLGPDGPVVVDVNAFPGFRGIPGAAEAVAGHVMRRAGAGGEGR